MLEQFRAEIDECDAILVATLLRRFQIAERIAEFKIEQGLALYQPDREASILEKLAGGSQTYPYGEQIKHLYETIFRLSRMVQMKKMLPFNVVLIGFMGSGKTTVGQYLAAVSGYAFVDIDQEIEKKTGLTIPEIFTRFGEAHFRKLETEAVVVAATGKKTIISCGGGVVLDKENVLKLKQNGKLIWLDASVETLYKRINLQGGRPLAQDKTIEEFRELYVKRQEFYQAAADCTVDTENRNVSEIADSIMHIGAKLQNK